MRRNAWSFNRTAFLGLLLTSLVLAGPDAADPTHRLAAHVRPRRGGRCGFPSREACRCTARRQAGGDNDRAGIPDGAFRRP